MIRSNGNWGNDPDKPGLWMIVSIFGFLLLAIILVAVLSGLQ